MLNAFVHVIESPSDFDLLDRRSEGTMLREFFALAGINHTYQLATSRQALRTALTDRLTAACQQFPDEFPLLHLSMHGNRDGLGLTDGTFLSWTEVREELKWLTDWSCGQLLIGISSCEGYTGIRMAMFQGADHPFGGIVANSDDTLWHDAAVAFVTFYHRLFKGSKIQDCVEAMRIASGNNLFLFQRGDQIKTNWAKYIQEQWKRDYEELVQKYGSNGLLFGGSNPNHPRHTRPIGNGLLYRPTQQPEQPLDPNSAG